MSNSTHPSSSDKEERMRCRKRKNRQYAQEHRAKKRKEMDDLIEENTLLKLQIQHMRRDMEMMITTRNPSYHYKDRQSLISPITTFTFEQEDWMHVNDDDNNEHDPFLFTIINDYSDISPSRTDDDDGEYEEI